MNLSGKLGIVQLMQTLLTFGHPPMLSSAIQPRLVLLYLTTGPRTQLNYASRLNHTGRETLFRSVTCLIAGVSCTVFS